MNNIFFLETSQLQVLKGTQMMSINTDSNFFSPSMLFEIQPVIETPVATNLPQLLVSIVL